MSVRFRIKFSQLAFIVAVVLLANSCNINNPCQGTKVGQIVKVSDEGILFSTKEIELIRGGLTDGSGVMGKPFHATVRDPSIAQDAVKAMESNKEVIITYKASLLSPVWNSESGIFVTSIKFR